MRASVHDDVCLVRDTVDGDLAKSDHIAFDLRPAALAYFDAGPHHVGDLQTQHKLTRSLALHVNAHNRAVSNLAVLNNDFVVWLCAREDSASPKVGKRAVGNVGV